ncbi:hypothetical protein FisN_11Lh198 [Fistulifera solaris]|uniref:Uncharacterized protein n=1 Tax=Fistulifera solaris TaxID=1519565 RepID=A0A1Z5J7Q9_FISSO|nr:hypothetical protein FisN_11Lh198 [Fistulifera solaris]|eukprot:GAX09821.1 hypothetical protein FisN_11Lh198 [Fistulifera solaris]
MSEDLLVVEEEEEKARIQAEARRQRILEGANRRMDQVSGFGDDDEDGNKNNKGSSKLAAMRRRRFANKKTKEEVVEKEEEEAETTVNKEEEEEKKQEKTTPVAKETKSNVDEESSSVVEEVFTPGTQPEEKKKYMGVAKMRRMRLQEKKQQEVQQQRSIPLQQRSTTLADRIPIYMHVLVVFLLFGAGLDVGMQLHLSYSKGDLPDIVQRGPLGPLEMKFVNIVPSVMNPWSTVEKSPVLEDSRRPTDYSVDPIDEFAEENTPKRGVDNHDANIDPLFGVDLDKYTAGSGLVMFLGRQAVKVHRLNLALFYYGPRRLVTGIMGLLLSFRMVPPLLGIIALFIRQVVASTLGAHLPAVIEDEAAHKDIVSTGVTMVKNFLAGSFPKLVTVYRAWTHLRSDMYVVTCGCLVGLALSHSMLVPDHGPVMEEPIGTGDEL